MKITEQVEAFAKPIVEEKGCTLEEMLRQTGENAKRLFSVE